MVLYMKGEIGVTAGKSFNELRLEHLYIPFSIEGAVEAKEYELVLGAGVTDEVLHTGWRFLFQHVNSMLESLVGEAIVDLVLANSSLVLDNYWMGSAMMSSLLALCITMMYLEPRLEVMGKNTVLFVEKISSYV